METVTAVVRAVAERASTDPIAVLPFAALRICAPFAASDPGKPAISAINIRHNAGMTRAEATNGHIAMRIDMCNYVFYCPEDFELKVSAKAFSKKVAYAREVYLYADGTAKIIGGKKDLRETLAIIPNWRDNAADGTTFPSLDMVWPDFSDVTGSVIAFNAGYISDIAAIVKEYSPNGIMQIQSTAPTQPAQIVFKVEAAGGGIGDNWDGKIAALIMPVQVRNW